MKNWRTTLFGALAAVWGIGDGLVKSLATGQPIDWKTTLFGIGIGLIGYFAKDFNVSGTGK